MKEIIVDLREAEHFREGTIPGAVNIPMNQVEKLYELPTGSRVCLFCQVGELSRPLAELMCDAGYDAYSLEGGYVEYLRENMPVLPETEAKPSKPAGTSAVQEEITVYADNAATTSLSSLALEAMMPYMTSLYGNPSSLHKVGQAARKAMDDSRRSIAEILGCTAREITFTSCGTESNNQAMLTALKACEKQGKRHIISTVVEHHSVLHALQKLEKEGCPVTFLGVNEEGFVDTKELEAAIREDTCLVSVMYANNEIGSIEPIDEISRICKEHGVLFHVDAVQAAGHLPIDVKAQGIDMLSISAHKFHGPKGNGVFYCRRGLQPANVLEGGAQERGHRSGTENVAGIVGMAAALTDAVGHMDENNRDTIALRDRLIEGLKKIPHSKLNGPWTRGSITDRQPGNVNFCFEGIEGETLLILLDKYGICASSGSACSAGSTEASHVLKAIGLPRELTFASLRLSINEENTESEIDYIIDKVTESVAGLREKSPMWHDRLEGRREYLLTE